MRNLCIFLFINCLTATILAQEPIFPPGQVLTVSSILDANNTVGTLAVFPVLPDTDVELFITNETNDHPDGITFFGVDSTDLRTIADLNQVFWEENPTVGTKDIVLNILAVGAPSGELTTESVTVRVSRNAVPVVQTGQSRVIASDALVGRALGLPIRANHDVVETWNMLGQTNWPDGTPQEDQIPGISQDEVFFSIDNQGQISVLKELGPFFNEVLRAGQAVVTISVSAGNDAGVSEPQDISIIVTEATVPIVALGQSRTADTTYEPGFPLADPLYAGTSIQSWTIAGLPGDPQNGNYDGAFNILNNGSLIAARYFDTVNWPAPPAEDLPSTVTIHVAAANFAGFSDPTPVTVHINDLGNVRCGDIPEGQTRLVSSSASPSELVGFPLDTHNLDSIWIDEGFIDGTTQPGEPNPTDVATAFSIEDPAPGSANFGQLRVVRPMRDYINTTVDGDSTVEEITKVSLLLRGHVSQDSNPGCPEFVEGWITVYILPADAGETGDPDEEDPNEDPDTTDITSFIDDPAMVQCIQAALGLFGSQPITATAALDLTHLDCLCVSTQSRPGAIASLAGIQLFPNLEFLNLSGNIITDIRALAGLTALTDLRLSGNLIVDIETSSPFASLVSLQRLDLSNNQITQANAFSTLANIEFMNLSDNTICDIGSLVALTQLGENLGINTGDTIILDNNRLSSIQAQQDIGELEAAGAFVTHTNDPACGTNANVILLQQWPFNTMLEFTDFINARGDGGVIPPCNVPAP